MIINFVNFEHFPSYFIHGLADTLVPSLVASIKTPRPKSNLWKKVFIFADDSRGLKSHHGREAWQQGAMRQKVEGSSLQPQEQSPERELEVG